MRSMRIPVRCALGLCALSLAFQGLRSPAEDKVGDKRKAQDVLQEWGFAKADLRGPVRPRNGKDARDPKHADLASQSFAPKEPMEKVWQHYADKCSHKGKFPGPGAGVKDGACNDKARFLINFSGGSERNKTYR